MATIKPWGAQQWVASLLPLVAVPCITDLLKRTRVLPSIVALTVAIILSGLLAMAIGSHSAKDRRRFWLATVIFLGALIGIMYFLHRAAT